MTADWRSLIASKTSLPDALDPILRPVSNLLRKLRLRRRFGPREEVGCQTVFDLMLAPGDVYTKSMKSK